MQYNLPLNRLGVQHVDTFGINLINHLLLP